MLLLSFHIVAIAILIAVVGSIAHQMGKKEGIRLTEIYYTEEQPPAEPKPESSPQDATPPS